MGGQLVTDVTIDAATGTAAGLHTITEDGKKTYYAADAVIFAVGITGQSRPELAFVVVLSSLSQQGYCTKLYM